MLKTCHCLLNELQRLNGTCRPASQNEMTRQEWDTTEYSIDGEVVDGIFLPGKEGHLRHVQMKPQVVFEPHNKPDTYT